MQRNLALAALAAVLLFAGGCNQAEKATPPPVAAPQPQAVKEAPQPAVAEKAPAVAPAPAPTPPPTAASAPPAPPKPAAAPAPAKTAAVAPEKTPPPPAAKAAAPPAAAPAPATKTTPTPPQSVSYKATNGTVTFNHQQHAASHPCSSCHTTDPPSKIEISKDKAHALCKGCHQQNGGGPTQCSGCHKK